MKSANVKQQLNISGEIQLKIIKSYVIKQIYFIGGEVIYFSD